MVDILRIFDMMDYKSITTSMESNLKKLSDFSLDSDLVELMMYMKLIKSLMYLVNTKPDIFFVVNALNQFMSEPR